MDSVEIPGTVPDTILRFAPDCDGRPLLTADHPGSGGHEAVVLERNWLLPLAAWFAGEAQPDLIKQNANSLPYGCWLALGGDEAASAFSNLTWAKMRCGQPFGTATVTIGPRGSEFGWTVILSSDARQDIALHLRRAHAQTTA